MLSHSIETLPPNEKFVPEKLKRSIKFESRRYKVVIPWKDYRSVLPGNYEAALKRLRSTEKRTLKEPEERSRKEDPKNREKKPLSPATYHTFLL